MEVPSEILAELMCENCGGYLSRGSVHLMDNVTYRCGRCLPSEKEQGTRIEAYEELAKLLTFPCRYRVNGCLSKVPFMENESHEEACPYYKYICPIGESGECEWSGIQTDLLEHCRHDHPDNVMENPCQFTHNITRSSLNNYLLWTLGVLFFIQTKVCTATRKIYHSVRLIGDPARASNYKYTLYVQNKDSHFSKEREVAPRGYLTLHYDSSIQTDINGLQTMLVDFTDTTFTLTIESVGIGTTMESSTAESSSANAHIATPVKPLEVKAECSTCGTWTEPVYRRSWLCKNHAPERVPCENHSKGCMYSDVNSKCVKHVWHYCQYSTRCKICSGKITSKTLDAHHSQAHGDIIHAAGTVCSVRPDWCSKYLIIDCDVGRAVCWYGLYDSAFVLRVHTPLPSEQLYKYRCTVEFCQPDTELALTRTSTVCYDRPYDWHVVIPLIDLTAYIKDKKVNIKITITVIGEPSQFIL